MLNKYPLWKYVMVAFVLAVAILYALPNLYGEDHAVQISANRGAVVDINSLSQVETALKDAGVSYKSAELENDQILVRLAGQDAQYDAREIINSELNKDKDDYVVALNLAPATPDWLEAIGGTPMKLGLDLRGGVHFLMEVDMNAAMEKAQITMVSDFKTSLREEKIRYRTVRNGADGSVDIALRSSETLEQAELFLKNRFRDLVFDARDDGQSFVLNASMSEQRIRETREYALQQNITIIRNRVNELGVAEPLVQRQGANRIVVQLPGIQDTALAKKILGATATLEFRMVDNENDVRDAMNGRVPPGSKLYNDRRTGDKILLKDRVILTGDHITDSRSAFDEYNRPQVSIDLDSKGGSKMTKESRSNIGKLMATVFVEYKPTGKKDAEGKMLTRKVEEVINAATIQSVLGSSFRITGINSQAEAQNLALLLRAGALIAPIQIVEERTVGPSLGQENIDLGVQAITWGFLMVLAFMLFYYRAFGVVANIALAANLVLIIGVMSLLPGATLTLPGMAGIVLTVGMAVDANVLIFERIREELRQGRSPQQAIHHGYDSAFSTIADANITTFIAAVILYAVGTGPIKGFAITLAIGIATSMFTAIVGTRAIVNLVWGGKPVKTLSI